MSEDVRRFKPATLDSRMTLDDNGKFVSVFDYDRLRAELAEKDTQIFCFEAELATAKEHIERLERLAALYADGNQIEAHHAAIALGLEDDDE